MNIQNTVASDETIEMKIAVACRNASGMADMPIVTVAVTRKECESGVLTTRPRNWPKPLDMKRRLSVLMPMNKQRLYRQCVNWV